MVSLEACTYGTAARQMIQARLAARLHCACACCFAKRAFRPLALLQQLLQLCRHHYASWTQLKLARRTGSGYAPLRSDFRPCLPELGLSSKPAQLAFSS